MIDAHVHLEKGQYCIEWIVMKSMIQKGVRILTASDAHVPQDVGRFIYEMNKRQTQNF